MGDDGYQLGRFGGPLDRVERPLPRRRARAVAPGHTGRGRCTAVCGPVCSGLAQRSSSARSSPSTSSPPTMVSRSGGLGCRFDHKHNGANGEQNRDGHHGHNLSRNHGAEGPTTVSPSISAEREPNCSGPCCSRCCWPRGVPMLAMGDERGSQPAAATTTPIARMARLSWLDWTASGDQASEMSSLCSGQTLDPAPAPARPCAKRGTCIRAEQVSPGGGLTDALAHGARRTGKTPDLDALLRDALWPR